MIAEKEKLIPIVGKRIYQKSYVYDPIGKPYAHITAFFECAWLSNHLTMLKYWNKLVSTKTCYDRKDCPADLVYTHKMFCNLVNAAWIIKKQQGQQSFQLQSLSSPEQEAYLNEEKEYLRDYPNYLGEDELQNPYLVINRFFEHFKLKEIHQHLYIWLNEGLSPLSYIDDFSATNKVYKQLRKLCEACWLIHERDIKVRTNEILDAINQSKIGNRLEDVIQLLAKVIPVDTIYNLSREIDRLDLLIVQDKNCNKAYSEFEPLIEMATLGYEKAECTVHNYGHLKELINKGHLFYSTACSGSNIVFQQNDQLFFQLEASHLEWAKNTAKPLFDGYMAKAVYFYKGAQQYLADEVGYMAAFMLQQACELTYRCLLKTFRGKDVKCHSPAVLRKYLKRYAPAIIGVFSEDETEELKYLSILEEAYIKARYEKHYEIELSLLQFLNERVGLLQDLAISSFETKMKVLEDAVREN